MEAYLLNLSSNLSSRNLFLLLGGLAYVLYIFWSDWSKLSDRSLLFLPHCFVIYIKAYIFYWQPRASKPLNSHQYVWFCNNTVNIYGLVRDTKTGENNFLFCFLFVIISSLGWKRLFLLYFFLQRKSKKPLITQHTISWGLKMYHTQTSPATHKRGWMEDFSFVFLRGGAEEVTFPWCSAPFLALTLSRWKTNWLIILGRRATWERHAWRAKPLDVPRWKCQHTTLRVHIRFQQ